MEVGIDNGQLEISVNGICIERTHCSYDILL